MDLKKTFDAFMRIRDLESYTQQMTASYFGTATDEQSKKLRGILNAVAKLRLELAYLCPDFAFSPLGSLREREQQRAALEWANWLATKPDDFTDTTIFVNPDEAADPGTQAEEDRYWDD